MLTSRGVSEFDHARFTGVSAPAAPTRQGRGAGKRIVRLSTLERLVDLGPSCHPGAARRDGHRYALEAAGQPDTARITLRLVLPRAVLG